MKSAPVAWSLVAAFLLAGTLAGAQSLADIAKKEAERRKAAKAPTKVYTNDDLPKYPTPPAATTAPAEGQGQGQPAANPAAPPAQPAPTDPPQPGAKPQEPAKDEAYWRGLIAAAQTKLERDQAFADALQSQVNALTNDFYARDDPAQRAVIETQRNKALAEMDRLKKEIADDKTAIAKVQEDARKEGVPPGWLR